MSRALVIVCLAVTASPFSLACSKEDETADKATTDKATVPAPDATKARDDYRSQRQRDLLAIDKSIADMEAKGKTYGRKTKARVDEALSSLKTGRDAFSRELASIESVNAAAWASTKERLDKEWTDLESSTEKASGILTKAGTVLTPVTMTCEDFTALADVEKPRVVYWLEGFNKNTKAAQSVVDVQETDRVVPVVVSECVTTPKEALSSVVGRHARHPVKPVAEASNPATLRCDEFLSLADVEKPELVYWADGFNRDGGPTDSFVDVDETDKLVPVVVTECTDAPKLTFWQKVKSHL